MLLHLRNAQGIQKNRTSRPSWLESLLRRLKDADAGVLRLMEAVRDWNPWGYLRWLSHYSTSAGFVLVLYCYTWDILLSWFLHVFSNVKLSYLAFLGVACGGFELVWVFQKCWHETSLMRFFKTKHCIYAFYTHFSTLHVTWTPLHASFPKMYVSWKIEYIFIYILQKNAYEIETWHAHEIEMKSKWNI